MGNKESDNLNKMRGTESTQRNFVLKVIDAKANEIKTALKSQGIEVIAITEVFMEKIASK